MIQAGLNLYEMTEDQANEAVAGIVKNTNAELDAFTSALTSPLSTKTPESNNPKVLFNPLTNKIFVNGVVYDADDSQSAIDSVPYLTKPVVKGMPEGEGWQDVSPEAYNRYLGKIVDPSLARLAAKNFSIGGSNIQLLAGRAAQFLGAEELGQAWVEDAIKDLYYNQPYQREFTSIEGVGGDYERHGAIDWFVANLFQQGPMLIESIGVALIGAGAGAIAGGGANPFTAVGGALTALTGKEVFKRSVLAAAEKYMKGQVLNAGEKKLLREAAGLTAAAATKSRNTILVTAGKPGIGKTPESLLLQGAKRATKGGRTQAMIGGAGIFSTLGNYATGVADIYGEVRETGVGDRTTAALGAIPYAAFETIPEFFIGGKILGLNPAKMKKGTRKAAEVTLRGGMGVRVAKGFGVGGTLEGLTELGQESLLLGLTNQMSDAETVKRLINSFAAGFAIGGPIGGIANIRQPQSSTSPINILETDKNAEVKTSNQKASTPDDGSFDNQQPIPFRPKGPRESSEAPISIVAKSDDIPEGKRKLLQRQKEFNQAQALINERPDLLTMDDNTFDQQKFSVPYLKERIQEIRNYYKPVPKQQTDTQVNEQMELQLDPPSSPVVEDTGPVDTGPVDPSPIAGDTTITDTGPVDTGPVDTDPVDTDPVENKNVTKEALDLLNNLKGGVLGSLNNNVKRILKENGIDVTSTTTPEDAINRLRAKAEGKPPPVVEDTSPVDMSASNQNVVDEFIEGNTRRRNLANNIPEALQNASPNELSKDQRQLLIDNYNTDENLLVLEDEFAPPVKPTLVDRRDKKDITKKSAVGAAITGGKRAGALQTPNIRLKEFTKIGYDEPVKGNILPETLATIYGNALNLIKITYETTSYAAAHHNGGIVLQGRWPYTVSITPNIIAHELGHASHSLLGDEINTNTRTMRELLAIENLLYPDLRNTIETAINNKEKLSPGSIEFFNYLLSPEELIAEFNVYRILYPEQANKSAPFISKMLQSVETESNLVKDRTIFPSGFFNITVTATEYFNGDYTKLNAYMTKGDALKKGGQKDAVQKRSTKKVDDGEQTGTGEEIPGGDTEGQETSSKSSGDQRLKKKTDTKKESGKVKTDKTVREDSGQQDIKPTDQTGQNRLKQGGDMSARFDPVFSELIEELRNSNADNKQQLITYYQERYANAGKEESIVVKSKTSSRPRVTKTLEPVSKKQIVEELKEVISQAKGIKKTINLRRGQTATVDDAPVDDAPARNLTDIMSNLKRKPIPFKDPTEAWEEMQIPGTVDKNGRVLVNYTDVFNLEEEANFFDLVNNNRLTYNRLQKLYETAIRRSESETRPPTAGRKSYNQINVLRQIALFDVAEQDVVKTHDILRDSIDQLINYAYIDRDANLDKTNVRQLASSYIEANLDNFSDLQRRILFEELLEATLSKAQYNKSGLDANHIPMLELLYQRGMLDPLIQAVALDSDVRVKNQPQWFQDAVANVEQLVDEKTSSDADATEFAPVSYLDRVGHIVAQGQEFINQTLARELDEHIAGTAATKITSATRSKQKAFLEDLYGEADPNYNIGRTITVTGLGEIGLKLKDYFNEGGELNVLNMNGEFVPVTNYTDLNDAKNRKAAIFRAKLTEQKKEKFYDELEKNRVKLDVDNRTNENPDDLFDKKTEDGNYKRSATSEPITNPVPRGKIELIVKQVLRKLKTKPTVTVVRNVEDLKTRFPKLYERAAAGREGDFDTTAAIGYSVGDQIIIFSDYANTEEQVRFTVAHEALGHFGFRAFMPRERLNALLNDIYLTESHIRNVADRNMEQGMTRLEAIEEALADSAAALDLSVMARFWNALKNILTSIGISQPDEMSRYLISQSRKNLQRGGRGVVSVRQLVENLRVLSKEAEYGRYSIATDRADLAGAALSSLASTKISGPYGSMLGFRQLFKYERAAAKQLLRSGAKTLSSPSLKGAANLGGELLETVQTMDNKARRSLGLSWIFKIFQDQQGRVKRLQQDYLNLTEFSNTPNWSKLGYKGNRNGPTIEELEKAGELLAYVAAYKKRQLTEKMILDVDDLIVKGQTGEFLKINPVVQKELEKLGDVSIEEIKNGIPVVLDILDGVENIQGKDTIYKPDFEITENIARIFKEQRKAVNQAAMDLFESHLNAYYGQRREAFENFRKITGAGGETLSDIDMATLKEIHNEYNRLYGEGSTQTGKEIIYVKENQDKAERFLKAINRSMHEPKKLEDWKQGREDTAEFQDSERYGRIINGLESIHNVIMATGDRRRTNAFEITKTFADLYDLQVKASNAEYRVKETIMGAYVPFTRRGKFQVMLKAYTSDGQPVALEETIKSSLPYYRADSRVGSTELVERLNETFGGRQYKVLNQAGDEVAVTFRAEFGKARETQPLSDSLNINEFTSILKRFNLNITPQERERIIVGLTQTRDRARKAGLQRSGAEGWDKDVVRSIAEHLETSAHMAGKEEHRYRLNKIMLDTEMWKGSRKKLNDLKKSMERAEKFGNPSQIRSAQQAYDKYAYMYRYMADVSGEKITIYKKNFLTGERIPTQVSTEGRGENYREEANRLLAWYSDHTNITQSTEDLLSGVAGGKLKTATVLMQLGGSIATAAVNLFSIPLNANAYLATYNPKSGYGGGFGFPKASSALTTAAWSVKSPSLAKLSEINRMLNQQGGLEEARSKHKLEPDELKAFQKATGEGVLQAAMFNALVGTARGGVNSNQWSKAIETWMAAFTYTEQYNRRVTFLAAYRLERDRRYASISPDLKGDALEEAKLRANIEAENFAITAVNTSQGEYAMYNRPEMARGNFMQYLFIYKQFTIITTQLIKNMDYKGKVYMLGLLLLMSGIKGIPFEEDFADLVDTLAQKFKIPIGTVDKELATFIDDVAPGFSPIAMRGFLDYYFNISVASRLGFGNMLPLTGALKAGADPWREVKDLAGPAWSALSGGITTAAHLAEYGADAIGLPIDSNKRLSDIFRESPIVAFRSMSDAWRYHSDGMITNAQGKVVSHEAPVYNQIMRVLGFYPSISTYQNDIVRMAKETANYAKALKTAKVNEYIKYRLIGDNRRMTDIRQEVFEHNRENYGTEFYFRDFMKSADRAYKAIKLPTLLRYNKYAPKGIRPEVARLMEAYGIDLNDIM